MAKYRSSLDFAAAYASNKQGFGVGTDNFIHIKEEVTPGTFVAPSIGTQGLSRSASTPSTDLSSSSNNKVKAAVDGNAAVTTAAITVTGLTTGTLVAAALETALNTALAAAGQDARVWVAFTGGKYEIKSQKVGSASAVVCTAAASADLGVELKLGTGNTGTETVGTDGGDFLWMTKSSFKMTQPFKESEHKSGRQALNIVRQKKMADGDIECYLNVATGGSPTIDTPLSLLLEGVLGKKTTTGSTIRFDASQPPTKYMSAVQGNNAFGRYFNGGYPKSLTVSLPGDGEAKIKFPMKAREGKYASIAQILGNVSASATVVTQAGQSKRFNTDSRVMVVDTDGRTILAGADGSLTVSSRTDGSDTLTLSATVTVSTLGFVVPWLPHVLDQKGTDNPVTGLQGTVSFDGGATTIDQVRSAEITFDPKVEDQDNWYGFDTNAGRIVATKADVKVKIDLLLSPEQFNHIINALEFTTVNIRLVLGPAGGRRYQFDMATVYLQAPDLPIPDNGPVIASFSGTAVQSTSGALDAFVMTLL